MKNSVSVNRHAASEINRLIIEGKSARAIEMYYDEKVEIYENNVLQPGGKTAFLEREKNNLARVRSMKFELLCQGFSDDDKIEFGEWVMTFEILGGDRFILDEASVRHWRGGRIVKEKFYYGETKREKDLNIN